MAFFIFLSSLYVGFWLYPIYPNPASCFCFFALEPSTNFFLFPVSILCNRTAVFMRWKKGSWKLWVLCISLQTKNWPGSSSIVGNGPLSLFNWALCQTCFQQQGQIFEWIEQAGVQEDQRRRWVYYGPAINQCFLLLTLSRLCGLTLGFLYHFLSFFEIHITDVFV